MNGFLSVLFLAALWLVCAIVINVAIAVVGHPLIGGVIGMVLTMFVAYGATFIRLPYNPMYIEKEDV